MCLLTRFVSDCKFPSFLGEPPIYYSFTRQLPLHNYLMGINSPSNINLDLRSAVTPDTVTAMIHELESESHTLMDVDNFYAYLTRELESHPEFSAISDKLALQVQKSHQEADLVTQEISKYNAQKFAKLREYIDEQYDQTAKLQNIVDALQSPDPHILSDMVHDR